MFTCRFAFIWQRNVADIIRQGLEQARKGPYNLVGDGAMSLQEIAAILQKPTGRCRQSGALRQPRRPLRAGHQLSLSRKPTLSVTW
ncbi:hypothetical protein I5L51_14055 [Pseudomonas mendocina]|nr:hypothetical protein [Pseudomonas mendocina]MBH3340232.1 hypothetical protein [Pseudomonas mendocina]